jgi:hypothetical protein
LATLVLIVFLNASMNLFGLLMELVSYTIIALTRSQFRKFSLYPCD